jgi:hypothetical protein
MPENEYQLSRDILTGVQQIQTTQSQQSATQKQQYQAILNAILILQESVSQNQLATAEMFGGILEALNTQNALLKQILAAVQQPPPSVGGVYFGTPISQ